mgnify:CR=1 FL=1
MGGTEHNVGGFSLGDRVTHKSFGEGILISYKPLFMDIELTVKFEEPTGMKKIMKNKI